MAQYFIEGATLTDIADAIREKEGTTAKIDPADYATRISAIETTPEDALFLEENVIVDVSGADVTEETVQATGILDDELSDQDAIIDELLAAIANCASPRITVTDDGAGTVTFTIPNTSVTHNDGVVRIG